MSKAVVILGAGASAGFGVPTLRYIFQNAHARLHLGANPSLRSRLETLFWKPRGLSLDTSHEGPTVEEILTLVRDSENQIYDLLPLLDTADLETFRRSLYVLIKVAIYDGKSTTRRCLNPLLAFARTKFTTVTWASFNWDCTFESSFYYSSGKDSSSRHNPQVVVPLASWRSSSSPHTFLKLHGGINWWRSGNHVVYLPFGALPNLEKRWSAYATGSGNGEPVILEPSYYKYTDPVYELLKPQWKYFVNALIEADYVLIIGYSLPEADAEARTAITLGFQYNQRARWVVIDRSDRICERYRQILGTARATFIASALEDLELVLSATLSSALGV